MTTSAGAAFKAPVASWHRPQAAGRQRGKDSALAGESPGWSCGRSAVRRPGELSVGGPAQAPERLWPGGDGGEVAGYRVLPRYLERRVVGHAAG
ncbi:hypothetical protein V1227_11235 [Lentzea sp. DG1S-22]|uniref:hypothetical protein n=1 Tax=Lentzea sp. DG1S-22 TaxID=3108822 RepID=UPI002E773AB9|nr:hypothetical protein [Lentzea sp. DG1S-22]WVH83293.1 hypothetical protein V1227_11235 [Lentzea sp. DG1S-22]